MTVTEIHSQLANSSAQATAEMLTLKVKKLETNLTISTSIIVVALVMIVLGGSLWIQLEYKKSVNQMENALKLILEGFAAGKARDENQQHRLDVLEATDAAQNSKNIAFQQSDDALRARIAVLEAIIKDLQSKVVTPTATTPK